MATENTNFEFNMESGAHLEKLKPEAREQLDQMRESHAAAAQQHESDHGQNRAEKIEAEEKRLTEHYEKKLDMPKPEWAPPNRLPTAEEIRNEANSTIERNHVLNADGLAGDHKIAVEDHVRSELRMPQREESYEERRAAFMERRQEQRDRDRQQEKGGPNR